jgi:hypothetical protein
MKFNSLTDKWETLAKKIANKTFKELTNIWIQTQIYLQKAIMREI